MEEVVTTGAVSHAKLQSSSPQQTNIQLFAGWMHLLLPNQLYQSTEGKVRFTVSSSVYFCW